MVEETETPFLETAPGGTRGFSVARLTPPGVGAMAVVRFWGPAARDAVRAMFFPHDGHWPDPPLTGRLVYGQVRDTPEERREPRDDVQDDGEHDNDARDVDLRAADDDPTDAGELIDDGILAILLDDEDGFVADLTVHGGHRIVERVLSAGRSLGGRVKVASPDAVEPKAGGAAEPNIEGDALVALSAARTRRAVRLVAAQRIVLPPALLRIADALDDDATRGWDALGRLLERSAGAPRIVEGLTLAVVGPVNAGKSTLINRLFPQADHLVDAAPGSTRDWVATESAMDGVPIRAIDTAGFNASAGGLEREAMDRGIEVARHADGVLVVLDVSRPVPDVFLDDLATALPHALRLIVLNKTDIAERGGAFAADRRFDRAVAVSARTGAGLSNLKQKALSFLSIAGDNPQEPVLFTKSQIDWIRGLRSSDNAAKAVVSLRRAAGALSNL